MEIPLASGPAELFARIDNEAVDQASLQAGVLTTTLDSAINWARKRPAQNNEGDPSAL